MCGIYGVVEHQGDAATQVFNGLKDIEYRGYDSWGVSYFDGHKFITKKEIGFLPKTQKFPKANLSLGHTRWATHGGVTKQNAHPHSDCTGKLVLVHNGIVENYLELKAKLKNHKFISETDTEVIVHSIEEELKKGLDLVKATAKVFNRLEGLSAILVSDGTSIVAVKNSSPLVLGQTAKGFVIASDSNAILPLTDKLIFLEDGIITCLSDTLSFYEVKSLKKVKVHFIKVPWKYNLSSIGKYPYYMLKEINEQPQVLVNVLQGKQSIKEVAVLIKEAFGTYFIGCGTAGYAALTGTYLFSKYAKKHVNFSIGSEFNYIEDFLKEKSLLIAVSQSGETIDTVEPVQSAKKKGSKVVVLTNVLGSTLYRLADKPLLLNAGVEKAVASTKAMISMLAHMILLTFYVAGKGKEGEDILQKSTKEIEAILEKKEHISNLADKILDSKHIYVLGRGLSYPVALESALKIKEISYIHAEGFASGELKHGVIALIEKGTPVIVFVPNDETKGAVLANAMEVRARGAYVIGVSFENNPVFDFYFPIKDVGASSIIPNIVFAQLLAYFLSLKLGFNPDKPRNLAKSVVVR